MSGEKSCLKRADRLKYMHVMVAGIESTELNQTLIVSHVYQLQGYKKEREGQSEWRERAMECA